MPAQLTVLLILALTAGMLSAQSPDKRPSTAAPKRMQLVTLNIVAFDGHGQPVGDLTADDFQIQDQGKRQQIVFFRRNESPTHEVMPRQPVPQGSQEYSNRSGATVQNATVILLDLLNANLSDRGSGWEGLSRALEHLESADNLYVYLLTAEAKLYAVHGLPGSEGEDTTSGRLWTQQIRTLLDKAVRTVNRLKPQDERDPTIRVKGTYQALGALASQLAAIPGRKNIVWVTHGIPIMYRDLVNDWVDTTGQMRQFSVALNRSDIAMYTVDQGGPGSLPTGGEGPGYQSQDTLQQMADLTGGRAYPGNNVEGAIPAAMASLRGSYLIRYEPPPQNWDGKFHKVRVNCERKGIHLQTQQGYYATAEAPLRIAYEAAVSNTLDVSGIGLTATVSPKANAEHTLHYQLHVDAADLLLSRDGDRDNAQLGISFNTITNGKIETSAPILMNLSLTKEQRTVAMKEGIALSHDEVVADSVQKVRIVVMDIGTGDVGALTVSVPH